MKIILMIMSVAAAFIVQWSFSALPWIAGALPIAAWVILAWFWHMELWERLWLAGGAGFLYGTFSLSSFEAAAATLILLAFVIEVLNVFFPAGDSRLARLATSGVGGIVFVILASVFTGLL